MTDERLYSASARLAHVRSEIAGLKNSEAEILAQIRELLAGEVGTIVVNNQPVLSVSYVHRFNEELARSVIPADQVAAISVISASKAKAALPGALYALCQKAADGPTIKVLL